MIRMQRYAKSKEVENILHSVLHIRCRRKDIAYVVAWKCIYWIRLNNTFVTFVSQSMSVICKNVNFLKTILFKPYSSLRLGGSTKLPLPPLLLSQSLINNLGAVRSIFFSFQGLQFSFTYFLKIWSIDAV